MTTDGQQMIPGALHVADDVIADLIGYAALESYGVVGMAAPNVTDGIAKLLPARSLRRGVVIRTGQDGVLVDLYVILEQGNNLATISQNLIDRVRYVLEQDASLKVADITIHIQGVHVQKTSA